ncbi:MAG: small-conductance mechanosensitive channel [Myxococcota bacterium]|jgi:small-conductance mechanosensitive channel
MTAATATFHVMLPAMKDLFERWSDTVDGIFAGASGQVGGLQISATGVIIFLAVGLGLFGLLRGLRYLIRVSRFTARRKSTLMVALTVVEIIVALAYVVSAVPMVFEGNPEYSPYFAVLVVLGVVWISWVAARDLVHGIFFQIGRVCKVGDTVAVGEVRGKVIQLGYRVLIVEQASGEEVLIPYTRLTRETIQRQPADPGATRHAFRVTPTGNVAAGLPLADAIARIQLAAFNHHWSSAGHKAQVQMLDDGTLEVGVFVLDPKFAPAVEASVRKALQTAA